MKVNSAHVQSQAQAAQQPVKASKADIQARIKEKFGVDLGPDKAKANKSVEKEADVIVSIDSKGNKKVENEAFGDIKSNDPGSEMTQEKLKGILKTGAFQFSPKEREALNAILNK